MFFEKPTPPRAPAPPRKMGYSLSNDNGRTARQYTPPPVQQECPSSGTQWAAENAVGIGFGIAATVLGGMGIGYLLAKDDNEKKTPTLNSLKNQYANTA